MIEYSNRAIARPLQRRTRTAVGPPTNRPTDQPTHTHFHFHFHIDIAWRTHKSPTYNFRKSEKERERRHNQSSEHRVSSTFFLVIFTILAHLPRRTHPPSSVAQLTHLTDNGHQPAMPSLGDDRPDDHQRKYSTSAETAETEAEVSRCGERSSHAHAAPLAGRRPLCGDHLTTTSTALTGRSATKRLAPLVGGADLSSSPRSSTAAAAIEAAIAVCPFASPSTTATTAPPLVLQAPLSSMRHHRLYVYTDPISRLAYCQSRQT